MGLNIVSKSFKKFVSLLLVAILTLTMSVSFDLKVFASVAPDTSWYNENATEFTIYTENQLIGFSNLVTEGKTFEGKIVKLGADIELTQPWIPIGLEPGAPFVGPTEFSGTFDGNGNTISNFEIITNDATANIGLFGETRNAKIMHLNILVSSIVVNDPWVASVGIFVGEAIDTLSLINCHAYPQDANAKITINSTHLGTSIFLGGLVGYFSSSEYTGSNSTLIENCSNHLNIKLQDVPWTDTHSSNDSAIGGLIGIINSGSLDNVTVNECYMKGNIEINHCNDISVGGLVGDALISGSMHISDSYFEGNIVSEVNVDDWNPMITLGGIIGHTGVVDNVHIKNCHVKGTLGPIQSETAAIGGIVGDASGGYSDSHIVYFERFLQGCTFTGDIVSLESLDDEDSGLSHNIGGIIGASDNSIGIVDCTSDGEINVSNNSGYVGGIAGTLSSRMAWVNNSFSRMNISMETAFRGEIGGLIGSGIRAETTSTNENGTPSGIKNSFYEGSIVVEHAKMANIGGITGTTNNKMENVYAKGDIIINEQISESLTQLSHTNKGNLSFKNPGK